MKNLKTPIHSLFLILVFLSLSVTTFSQVNQVSVDLDVKWKATYLNYVEVPNKAGLFNAK